MKRVTNTAGSPIAAVPRGGTGSGAAGTTGSLATMDTARRVTIVAAIAALGYYLGSVSGLALQFGPTPVSGLWPSNAFLLGVLLMTRRDHWWIVLAAIVPAHLLAHGPVGVPASILTVQLGSNMLQAALSAMILQRVEGERPRLEKLKSMGSFIGIAAIAVPAVVALLTAGAFDAIGWTDDVWTTWRIRFQSNALAVLTITPLVLLVWQKGITMPHTRKARYALEAAATAAGIVALGYWIAVAPGTEAPESLALLYLPLPMLLLATIRFGLAGACLSVLLLGAVMVWGALHGDTAIAQPPAARALAFNLFLTVTAIPLVLLAALLEERNRAQRRVSESRQDLQELMESTAAIPWQADLETLAVTYIGPQAAGLFGYPVQAWRRQGFWVSRLHPEDRELALTIHEKARSGVDTFEFECRMIRSSGKVAWLHNTVRIERHDGERPRIRGFMIDVTSRKLAESEERQHREELARLNRIATMGEFAASITHELLQPLSAILNNAEAAEMYLNAKPPALADVRELIIDIRRDNQHAVEIIRRTRKLLQKHEIRRKAVDMNGVVRDIIALLSIEAETRSIRVRFELDPELRAVSGDRVHLQQVMTNLALNAFEAMTDVPEGARALTVRTAQNGNGMASVTVSDTGPGIAEHVLARLFEPFCTTKGDGLGMGLSITRTIVEAHQGRIWGENNPGAGATFGFTVPLDDSRSP